MQLREIQIERDRVTAIRREHENSEWGLNPNNPSEAVTSRPSNREFADAARKLRSELQSRRVSQKKRVPRFLRVIRWCMFRVNNCMTAVGPVMLAFALWAYFKDLHLEPSSNEAQTIFVLQVMSIVTSGFMTLLGMLGNQSFKEPRRERKNLYVSYISYTCGEVKARLA